MGVLATTLHELSDESGPSHQDRPPVEDYVRSGHQKQHGGDRLDVGCNTPQASAANASSADPDLCSR